MTSPFSAGTRARSWRFLARPGWVGGTLAAVAFAVVCWTVLAPWQFGRHAERSADNARIAAAATAATRPVTERLSTTTPLNPSQTWQPVTATGVFEPENEVYVRLRQDAAGRPASEVLVPLRLADGNALLVDRGYVTVADLGAGLPVPPPPAGQVTVTGRLQPFQPDPLARQSSTAADGRTEVTGIEPGVIPGTTGPVLQGFVQLDADSPGVLTAIGLPQTDAGPFLSYAVQWCIFGAVALLGIGFFIVREYRFPGAGGADRADAGAGDDADDAARPPGGPPAPTSRGRSGARGSFDRSQLYDPQ